MAAYNGLSYKRLLSTLDTFNQVNTAEYTPIVELRPLPDVSPLRNYTRSEGGSVSVVDGEIEIDGNLGKTGLYSRKRGRYLPGLIGMAGIGVRIPDPDNGHYEFGYGDWEGNRFGLEIDNGDWYTFIESSGNRYYRKPRSQWKDRLDGTGDSGINLDITTGGVLRLPFGWYGYLSVIFDMAFAGEYTDSVVEFDRSGHDISTISITQPDLPIFAECSSGVMYVGGRQYGVFGRYNPEFRITSPDVVTKTVGATYEPVLSFKFKNNLDIKWRGIPAYLDSLSIATDTKVEWAVYVDTQLTGDSFADIVSVDANETVMQIDTSATAFTAGYKLNSDFLVAGERGNSQSSEDKGLSDIPIPSGSIITLAARSLDTSSTIDAIMRIREEW